MSSAALRMTRLYERRVDAFRATGINSYFLDCDAFGDLSDDYDPRHPMTPSVDRKNRTYRMGYLSREAHLVTGSESAAAWSLSSLHFTHGPHTIQSRALWPILSDRQRFGGWRPYGRPDIFFRSIATPTALRPLFDPAYRIPLYQAAFHELVVSTDRWEFSPVKLRDLVQVRALLQLLYGVPPMWTLDRRAIEAHAPRMVAHNRVFEPIHREIGGAPMTDFEWLTPDRLVQRSRFGGKVELTANFGARPHDGIPTLCIRSRWLADGRTEDFCPAPMEVRDGSKRPLPRPP